MPLKPRAAKVEPADVAPESLVVAAAAAATPDLSREIEQAIGRRPRDRVRCARVFEDYYRCNWWAPTAGADAAPQPEWVWTALHRVRMSRFLRARITPDGLNIQEVAGDHPDVNR
jgi:hypothetical protein